MMRQHQIMSASNGGRGVGAFKLVGVGLLALFLVLTSLAWVQQMALQKQYAAERVRLDSLVANFTRTVAALQGRQQRQHEAQGHQLQRTLEMLVKQAPKEQRARDKEQLRLLTSTLGELVSQGVRSALEDPTQAAILRETLAGDRAIGSRVVRFKGASMLMLALKSDEWVGQHLLVHGIPWEQELLGVLMELVRTNSTVVDVGANLGASSVFLAHVAGTGGQVYSFQPARLQHQLLCANAMVNSLPQIHAERCVLSYTAATVLVDAYGRQDTNARQSGVTAVAEPEQVFDHASGSQGVEMVQARTLDSYALKDVSLIKVDVQGMEALVFHGARKTIRRELPVIAFGMGSLQHTLTAPKDVLLFNTTAFLAKLGYKAMPGLSLQYHAVMLPPGHPRLVTAVAPRDPLSKLLEAGVDDNR